MDTAIKKKLSYISLVSEVKRFNSNVTKHSFQPIRERVVVCNVQYAVQPYVPTGVTRHDDDDDDDNKANIYVQLNFANFISFVHVRLQQMIDIYQVQFLSFTASKPSLFIKEVVLKESKLYFFFLSDKLINHSK